MALYSRTDFENDKPLPSLPSPTLTNPDLVLPDDAISNLLPSPTRTIRRAPAPDLLRDKTNEHAGSLFMGDKREQSQEKRGLMSRKMMLVRSQTGSANGQEALHVVGRNENTPLASSPLLGDKLTVMPNNNGRRGSTSSLDSDDMAKMPEFLAKYRIADQTDDDVTDTDTATIHGRAYDEQRKAKEEEEQASALLSKRAEEILANAKKRLNLMEGNLRGARDLVAPLTAANLKRATSLSSAFSSPGLGFAHRRLESIAYDSDPYNPSRRMLHSQTSSPTIGRDFMGHARGGSDTDHSDRPTSMIKNRTPRFPVRPSDTNLNGALRSTRSYDSLGISKLVIPAGDKQQSQHSPYASARSKDSADSNLEPLREDDADHIETSYRNSFRAPEVIGVTTGSGYHYAGSSTAGSSTSASDDLRDQMASLKGRISSLRERARENNLKRQSMNNMRNSSPFSNAAHSAPEFWYNHSNSSRTSPPLDHGYSADSSPHTPLTPGTHYWQPGHHATGSRNAFAEQAARQQMQHDRDNSHELPADETFHYRSQPRNAGGARHQHTSSQEMPGAYVDTDGEDGYASSDQGDSDLLPENEAMSSDDDYMTSSEEEHVDGDSIYEDANLEPGDEVAHEDREDAFDYEHFFLHSAMGSYNAGQIDSDSDASSVSSAGTAKAPQPVSDEEDLVNDNDVGFDDDELVLRSQTPEKLRSIEARLQNSHERSMSNESLATLMTFATAEEGRNTPALSRSASRLDWPQTPNIETRPPTATNRTITPTMVTRPSLEDDSSDRADSGVGGLSRAPGQTTPKSTNGGAASSSSARSPTSPSSQANVDPTATAVKTLLDPQGKSLGLKDNAVLFSLIESLRRVCVGLQEEDENQYESRVLRRRLDDARRVLDGLPVGGEDV